MDFSKFKTSDWLKIGGALVFLVFGFLSWVKAEFAGFASDDANVFDFFWTGTLPWILVIATGVLSALLVMGTLKKDMAPWAMIFLAATAAASLLVLIRLIFNPLENKDAAEELGIEFKRGIGLFGSVIGSLAATAGAFMGFKESDSAS